MASIEQVMRMGPLAGAVGVAADARATGFEAGNAWSRWTAAERSEWESFCSGHDDETVLALAQGFELGQRAGDARDQFDALVGEWMHSAAHDGRLAALTTAGTSKAPFEGDGPAAALVRTGLAVWADGRLQRTDRGHYLLATIGLRKEAPMSADPGSLAAPPSAASDILSPSGFVSALVDGAVERRRLRMADAGLPQLDQAVETIGFGVFRDELDPELRLLVDLERAASLRVLGFDLEARELVVGVLAHPEAPATVLARAYYELSRLRVPDQTEAKGLTGDPNTAIAESRKWAKRGLPSPRARDRLGWCDFADSVGARKCGDLDVAHAAANSALDSFRLSGNRYGMAAVSVQLGFLSRLCLRLPDAEEHLQQAQDLASAGDPMYSIEVARSLQHHGQVRLMLGDIGAALDYIQRSHRLAQSVGDRECVAFALGALGCVFFDQEVYAEAGSSLGSAADDLAKLNHLEGEALMRRRLGACLIHLGRHEEAQYAIERSLELYNQSGNKLGYAECHATLLELDPGSIGDREDVACKAITRIKLALEKHTSRSDTARAIAGSVSASVFRTSAREHGLQSLAEAVGEFDDTVEALGLRSATPLESIMGQEPVLVSA